MIQFLILAIAALSGQIQIYNADDLPEDIEITLPYIDMERNFPDHPGLVQKLDSAYCYMINSYNYRYYHNEALIDLIIWERNENLYFTFIPDYSLNEYYIDVAAKRNYIYIGYFEYKDIPVVIFRDRDMSGLKISSNPLKKKKFCINIGGLYIDDRPYWNYKIPIVKDINDAAPHGMMLYEMYEYMLRHFHKIKDYIVDQKISSRKDEYLYKFNHAPSVDELFGPLKC